MSIPANDFFSIKEFADKLHVHPNTVRRAIKKGRISAFRVGAAKKSPYRIPSAEIDRLAIFDMEEMITKILDKRMEKNSINH
jgi:excisionase family DNA binding protein